MPLFLQTKLKVDTAGDRYESEADVVANRIADGAPAPPISSLSHSAPAIVQRKCACEESGTPCEHCAEKKEEEQQEGMSVQRKPVAGTALASDVAGGAPPGVDASTLSISAGQSMSPSVRAPLQRSFGRDLSNVRIHEDGVAMTAARTIGAQAFTHQADIYFDAGKYEPASESGQRLLAHELTHVVQQGAARAPVAESTTGKPENH